MRVYNIQTFNIANLVKWLIYSMASTVYERGGDKDRNIAFLGWVKSCLALVENALENKKSELAHCPITAWNCLALLITMAG